MKKWLIIGIVMFLLFIIPICYSAPPPTTVNTNPSVGLEIQYPLIETYKLNENIEFLFHVYNKSNGLIMTNETTSCIFDLYNQSGAEIYSSIPIIDTNLREFETTIIGTNFSSIGTYSYMIDCNTSSLGGFSSVAFEITEDGYSRSVPSLYMVIIIGIIIGLFVCLGVIFSKEENFTYYLSFLFWYIAMLIPLFGIRVIASLEGLSQTHLNLINMMYQVYLYFYAFMVIILVIYFLFTILRWLYGYDKSSKWKRRMREDY